MPSRPRARNSGDDKEVTMSELMLERSTGRRGLAEIEVSEAMHPGVLTCPLETSLRDVARMMSLYRIHAVVAYGEDSDDVDGPGLWVVVSDLDLVQATIGGELEERTAGATAVTPALTIAAEDTLQHAAQLMSEHELTHLIVVARGSKRPVGVLSTLDIARALAAW
jgi:CBS domain-containing protein